MRKQGKSQRNEKHELAFDSSFWVGLEEPRKMQILFTFDVFRGD